MTSPPASRILLLHDHAILGGAEHSIALLAGRLDPRRFAPVVGLSEDGLLQERLKAAGIPTARLDLPRLRPFRLDRWLTGSWRLSRWLRANGIALIHGNTPRSNLYAWLAARLAGIPVVWHMRNVIEPGMRDIERTLAVLPDRIVCNSQAVRARFSARAGARAPEVIYTGVDTARFAPPAEEERGRMRSKLGLGGEVAIALVGRIGVKQGHGDFLKAAKLVLEKKRDCRFFVVGGAQMAEDREWEKRTKDLAQELGLGPALAFLGHRDDVAPVMGAMDILVFPSRFEAFSRAVLEAMACGAAVIASRVGGMLEAVEDGVSARLVPPANPIELAAAILELADDPAQRSRLGGAARRRAEERFSIEAAARKIEDVYERLLAA